MNRLSARYALLPLLAVLAACGDEANVAGDDTARGASGEILEGSISDDMLPLESLSSQPPVAAPLPGETVPTPADAATAAPGEAAPDAGPASDPAAAEPATSEPAAEE